MSWCRALLRSARVAPERPPLVVGRYAIHDELAAGGMGTVHIGRLVGAAGFTRTVAIKRLHPQLARDEELAAMLLDEARIASRIRHPNVVPTLDVVARDGELFVVMEYFAGESLAALLRARGGVPLPIGVGVAIMRDVLAGLHAAHEATDEGGLPLSIVHRDVSPQNVFVGQDGIARVLDFGIAKAKGRYQQTGEGVIKGKLGYMPPEQVRGEPVDCRADVYAAGIVLWESLTSRRLFQADSDWATAQRILGGVREPASLYRPEVSEALDEIILRACHVDPAGRFPTAEAFGTALEKLALAASPREVRATVETTAGERLKARAALVLAMEERPHEALHETAPTRAPDPASSAPTASVTAFIAPPPTPVRSKLPLGAALGLGVALLLIGTVAALAMGRRSAVVDAPASIAPASPSSFASAFSSAVSSSPHEESRPAPSAASALSSFAPSGARASATAATASVRPPARPGAVRAPSPGPAPPGGLFDTRH